MGPDPLSKIAEVWKDKGVYTTHAIYYIGVLHSLVGLNFYAFKLKNKDFIDIKEEVLEELGFTIK